MQLFTPGAIIHGTKIRGFFFRPVCRFFPPSLREETGRPIRFELRSRAWSSCCCTKRQEWWRCFENQCKQTQKKSILREWMPSSCYLWFLRTYLFSHVLNIISITVFLSRFGAFLRSEMKFAKLLVQPPHHLVTCAHDKNSFSFFWTIVIALVHSCNWLCTFVCGFLHYQLLISCCSKCII